MNRCSHTLCLHFEDRKSFGFSDPRRSLVAVPSLWKQKLRFFLSLLTELIVFLRLLRRIPLSSLQVHVDDTVEMLPKSRRALTIQEIAALARSSLHGERIRPGGARRRPSTVSQRDLALSPRRDLPGRQGPCDQAHGDGSGQSGPPDRMERLVQTNRHAGAGIRLQLLLRPHRGGARGPIRCR